MYNHERDIDTVEINCKCAILITTFTASNLQSGVKVVGVMNNIDEGNAARSTIDKTK